MSSFQEYLTDRDRTAIRRVVDRGYFHFNRSQFSEPHNANEDLILESPNRVEIQILEELPRQLIFEMSQAFPDSDALAAMLSHSLERRIACRPHYFAVLQNYNPKVFGMLEVLAKGETYEYDETSSRRLESSRDPELNAAKDAEPCRLAWEIVDSVREGRETHKGSFTEYNQLEDDNDYEPFLATNKRLLDAITAIGTNRFETLVWDIDSSATKRLIRYMRVLDADVARKNYKGMLIPLTMKLTFDTLQRLANYASGEHLDWKDAKVVWHLEAAGKALAHLEHPISSGARKDAETRLEALRKETEALATLISEIEDSEDE